jgi:hypothetical protein
MSLPNNQNSTSTKESIFFPAPINKLEDTGLSALWLQDLALKIMYFQGYMTGFKVAEEVG